MQEANESVFCTQCGTSIARSAQFCDQCGSPVARRREPTGEVTVVAKGRGNHPVGKMLGAAALVIVALWIVGLLTQGKDGNGSTRNNPAPKPERSRGVEEAYTPPTIMATSECLERGKRNSEVDEYEIATTIVGTVKNNCGRDFSYVEISFKLLDHKGDVVGTAMANQTNLRAGETWKYKALGSAAYSNQFDSITAY
jgi:hypothetical protein